MAKDKVLLMKLRYVLFVIIAAISLLLNLPMQPVFAQSTKEPTGFSNVTLWIYPEYDDPRLLVMLEGKITGAEAPALVRFLVPAAAEMYSAGGKDAQGNYTGGPPNRKTSSIPGWDEISYELPAETFRVEYYADEIVGMPDKTISYDFGFLYPISDLRVVVQQPLKASNFAVIPAGTASSEEQFKVQTYNFSNLSPAPDKPVHFDVSYTKLDLNPSIQSEQGNSTGSSPSPSGTGLSGGWITLITVSAVVIAVVFFWLGSKRKSRHKAGDGAQRMPTRAERRKRSAQLQKKGKTGVPEKGQAKTRKPESKADEVCYRCGGPVTSSDRFCPICGNKLD
jgi:hypothetical protein